MLKRYVKETRSISSFASKSLFVRQCFGTYDDDKYSDTDLDQTWRLWLCEFVSILDRYWCLNLLQSKCVPSGGMFSSAFLLKFSDIDLLSVTSLFVHFASCSQNVTPDPFIDCTS